jgi:hypothetical protein
MNADERKQIHTNSTDPFANRYDCLGALAVKSSKYPYVSALIGGSVTIHDLR